MILLQKYRKPLYVTMYYLLLCSLFACETQKEFRHFDDEIVQILSKEDTLLPSRFSSIPFFFRCSPSEVAIVYMRDIRSIYNLYYRDMSFSEFLSESLNQKINIKHNGRIIYFSLDGYVTENYKNKDFNTFLKLFTIDDNRRIEIKSGLTEVQNNTLHYYLFLNGYLVSYDDYIGKEFANKTYTFYKP